jgi:hypothetical protein
MIAVLSLLVLMINQEISLTSGATRTIRLGILLNVAVVPLLVGFLMTAIMLIVSALE